MAGEARWIEASEDTEWQEVVQDVRVRTLEETIVVQVKGVGGGSRGTV